MPLVLDFAKSAEDRQVMEVIFSPISLGYPSFMGPGVPKERVEIMRRAFDKTMQDPQFIEPDEATEPGARSGPRRGSAGHRRAHVRNAGRSRASARARSSLRTDTTDAPRSHDGDADRNISAERRGHQPHRGRRTCAACLSGATARRGARRPGGGAGRLRGRRLYPLGLRFLRGRRLCGDRAVDLRPPTAQRRVRTHARLAGDGPPMPRRPGLGDR